MLVCGCFDGTVDPDIDRCQVVLRDAGDACSGIVGHRGRGVAAVVGVGGDFGECGGARGAVAGVRCGGAVDQALHFSDGVGIGALFARNGCVDRAFVGLGHALDAGGFVVVDRGRFGRIAAVSGPVGDLVERCGLGLGCVVGQGLDFLIRVGSGTGAVLDSFVGRRQGVLRHTLDAGVFVVLDRGRRLAAVSRIVLDLGLGLVVG